MRLQKKTKVLLVIIWLFLLVDAAIYFKVVQIKTFLYSKWVFTHSRTPELYIVPENRAIQSRTNISGNLHQISSYGLTFDVPWGEEIEQKTTKDLSFFRFSNDIKMMVRDKSDYHLAQKEREEIFEDLPDKIKNMDSIKRQSLLDFYNKLQPATDYELWESIYSSSPNKISLFSSKQDSVINFLKLSQKISAPGVGLKPSKIYEFNTGTISGFQINMKSSENDSIWIMLYDQNDNDYMLTLNAKYISQSDIDILLSSLKVN